MNMPSWGCATAWSAKTYRHLGEGRHISVTLHAALKNSLLRVHFKPPLPPTEWPEIKPRPPQKARKYLSEGSPCPTETGYGYVPNISQSSRSVTRQKVRMRPWHKSESSRSVTRQKVRIRPWHKSESSRSVTRQKVWIRPWHKSEQQVRNTTEGFELQTTCSLIKYNVCNNNNREKTDTPASYYEGTWFKSRTESSYPNCDNLTTLQASVAIVLQITSRPLDFTVHYASYQTTVRKTPAYSSFIRSACLTNVQCHLPTTYCTAAGLTTLCVCG
jgi:hypothetical protein